MQDSYTNASILQNNQVLTKWSTIVSHFYLNITAAGWTISALCMCNDINHSTTASQALTYGSIDTSNQLIIWTWSYHFFMQPHIMLYINHGSNLNFSSGTQPRSVLHIGQHSNSSSEILLYMHFLQTGWNSKDKSSDNHLTNNFTK